MRLRRLLGLHAEPSSFEGSAAERSVYEAARKLWTRAGYHVKHSKFVTPTLGMTVRWTRGWTRRAA